MKHLNIFILLLSISTFSFAQEQEKITLTSDKLSQIIFPKDIEKIKGGFIPSEFSIEIFQNILYIQPLSDDIKGSNLSIVTKDGFIYMLDIIIAKEAVKYSYIIEEKNAVNFKKSSTTIENIEKKETEKNNGKDLNILSKKGFIQSSNGAEKYSIGMFITGLYADKDYLYVRVLVENKSNIIYNISAVNFFIENLKKSKASSTESTTIFAEPLTDFKTVPIQSSKETVFKFDKLTINDSKHIKVNLLEENGERNLTFNISSQFLKKTIPLI